MITQERLKEILDYDPDTGLFTRKAINNPNQKIGQIAGSRYDNGYVCIMVDNKLYKAHRLVWFYIHGVWPSKYIDHINGIRHDNRIDNLRECSKLENAQNIKIPICNKSGYMGVSWAKVSKKWKAQIKTNGKVIGLGYFDDPAEAHRAYLAAKAKYHTFNPVPR
jgi:hypothetical protein